MSVSKIILNNLANNFDYAKRVVAYLKPEYFTDTVEKIVYQKLDDFIAKYNACPDYDALFIEMDNDKKISENQFKDIDKLISDLKSLDKKHEINWLIDQTEKFCKERAIYNALTESIEIYEGKSKTKQLGSIPDILNNALAVSFDASIGHDYLEDFEKRFDYYHRKEEKVSTGLRDLDHVLKGGLSKATMGLLVAGPHSGKTSLLCYLAASALKDGKNVLYITLEMAENEIARRIDANLFDMTMDNVLNLPLNSFGEKINSLKKKTNGKLKIKEYPTGAGSVSHFRACVNELKLKQGFFPDIVLIDYLNICASSRIKAGAGANMYSYVKSIGEELRGWAQEINAPLWTATQLNRCLLPQTIIETEKENKQLKDIAVGDKILSKNGVYNTVTTVFKGNVSKAYKIKMKSGKEIICSGNHIFPVGEKENLKTIHTGLTIGDKLKIR